MILRFVFLIIFWMTQVLTTFGQFCKILQPASEEDSSYYHLTKISDNEYWACGERGVINAFDSSGHFKILPFSLEGKNILKAERFGNTVFLATDDGIVFRYRLNDSTLIRSNLKGFSKKCFYDFRILSDGRMLLCGGSTGISKGYKKIPKGFIVLTDTSLAHPKTVWRSYRKFVWSLCEGKEGDFYAATFNGVNSQIWSSANLSKWRKFNKVPGLIHDLMATSNGLSYVGGTNAHYTRTGMAGFTSGQNTSIPQSGCIWSQEQVENGVLACSQSGNMIFLKATNDKPVLQYNYKNPIYDFKFLTDHSILAVGHGRYAALLYY